VAERVRQSRRRFYGVAPSDPQERIRYERETVRDKIFGVCGLRQRTPARFAGSLARHLRRRLLGEAARASPKELRIWAMTSSERPLVVGVTGGVRRCQVLLRELAQRRGRIVRSHP
jgi:hypothetical protein